MKRIYTDETFDRMAEMRERGLSYGQIGRLLNMSPGAVSWHCLRLGVESPKPLKGHFNPKPGPTVMKRGNHVVRRFTPAEDRMLLEMEMEGIKRSEICKALGRSNNSVLGRLMTLARRDARAEAAIRE